MKSKVPVAIMLSIAGLITSIISSCNVPLQTQNINSEPKTCENAISSAKSQLKEDRQLTVEIFQANDASRYAGYPQDRPDSYSLLIGGNAANSAMNLSALLNSVATEIVDNCKSIGLVIFSLDKTHYAINYGLMPDGKVEKFRCPQGFDVSTYVGSHVEVMIYTKV